MDAILRCGQPTGSLGGRRSCCEECTHGSFHEHLATSAAVWQPSSRLKFKFSTQVKVLPVVGAGVRVVRAREMIVVGV